MLKSVTSAINDVHKNTVSTYGDPRTHPEYGFPLVPPIQLSAAYSFDSPENLVAYHEHRYQGNRYCRDANSGTLQLERYFEALFPGTRALMYNSGMSAMAAALDILMPQAGKVYLTSEAYRKTFAYLERQAPKQGINIDYFRSLEELGSKLSDQRPALVVLESPTNPHMHVHDFAGLRTLKEKFGCAVIADISIAGLCNIDFDFSCFECTTLSCTKYISGHNDLLGGILLVGSDTTFDDLWNLRSERGGLLDPFSSYLLLRSLRTYDMRVTRQVANADAVLEHIERKPLVTAVYHPRRGSPEQAEIFARYYRHGGSMVSFVVERDVAKILTHLSQLHSIKMAPSFGAIDTLIEVPSVMSHYGKTEEQLRAIGLEPNLVRLSVGCEPVDDLLADVDALFEGMDS